MRSFRGKRKQRVLWWGDRNRDFFQSFGQAWHVPPVTSFVPLFDITNADVGLTLAEEEALGGPTQGTLQGQLVGQAYNIKRLVAHMSVAINLRPDDASTGHNQARHVIVRMGIFKGMVDEQGALLNGNDFELAGSNAVVAVERHGTFARQNRFVWLWERLFTNYLALNPVPVTGGWIAYPLISSDHNGPWTTPGGLFAFPSVREVDIDLKRLGTAGPGERWFLARWATDAETASPDAAGKVDIQYHWNARVLLARSSRFRKKPGV